MLARTPIIDLAPAGRWAPLGRRQAMRSWQSAVLSACKGRARALALAWALQDLIGAAGFATVGDEALASLTALDVRNVGHGLKDLEQSGLIRRERGRVMSSGWRQRLIRPTIPANFVAPEWPLPDRGEADQSAETAGKATGGKRRVATRLKPPDYELKTPVGDGSVEKQPTGRAEGPAPRPSPIDRETAPRPARVASAPEAPRSDEPPPPELPDVDQVPWWEPLFSDTAPDASRKGGAAKDRHGRPFRRCTEIPIGETDDACW